MKKLTITLDDDEYAHVKTQLKGYVRKLVQIDKRQIEDFSVSPVLDKRSSAYPGSWR